MPGALTGLIARAMACEEPYGYAQGSFPAHEGFESSQDIRGVPASREHLEEWPARSGELGFRVGIESVEILGYPNRARFSRGAEGLSVEVEGEIRATFPVCLRITLG